MAGDPKRTFDINYLRILARKLQNVPAWRDMALACNEVLGNEIDQRRRKLEKIRDSVKYRRGDTLTRLAYYPESDKLAVIEATREVIDIPIGTIIDTAIVKNVARNIAFYNHPDTTDYLDLSFTYDGVACRWLKPVNITQERDALLKNSYIMGFDFFNTKLNDEDLQRLYERVQMYWPESGASDKFMKFIGYIKNMRLDLVFLWTEDSDEFPSDDPDTEYPYLEPFDPTTMTSVKDGGNNWQTSHVEISYNLDQFNQFYVLNLDDIEQLFYYFAPIILVLERITGTIDIETPIGVAIAPTALLFHWDTQNTQSLDFLGQDGIVDLRSTNFKYTNALIAGAV